MNVQVLIADDEPLIRRSVKGALVEEGFQATEAASGAEAWERFREDRPDVVLLDLRLGDVDGLELLRRIRQEAPDVKVVLISAHGSIESAVAAMKLGAYDFIKKPFELDEIVAAVRNAARTNALENRVAYFAAQEKKRAGGAAFIHGDPVMARRLDEIRLIAGSPVPMVLLLGESGTGKQGVARMLHEQSSRAAGPFVELNCSAIPESLVESELFGHERGAFSDARERKPGLVEIADGGTLFLDEIGDMGLPAQAKVLTFLEQRTFRRIGGTTSRRVDTRVVAATNRNLEQMVQARTLREDLYYRLNAITVRLPPLRERRRDISPLAQHFLAESSRELGRRYRSIAPEAMNILERYHWPGNVRELRSIITRAVLLNDAEVLLAEQLPVELVSAVLAAPPVPAAAGAEARSIPTLEEMELGHIRRVLEICGGNRTVAAQHLGITRQTLAKKIGLKEDAG
ncbi:MAG TPA: sigma-54 dependent transcriptional regulator [Polyangia bacterium]|jgi:DNA-binding NtrC family response regulator|nr:sigma-54 dependent transcriptional regulator [Polyangia bacterium]